MNSVIIKVSIVFFAYMFGSIPWGVLIAKSKGIDIRKVGSGNIGATNVNRTLGKKYGILCFSLDFFKGFIPVMLVSTVIKYDILKAADIIVVATAAAALLGHLFPIYLKFKGGKGVSTIAGILLAIAPLSLFVSGILWIVIFYSFRYVSLASILAAFFLPVSAYLFNYYKIWNISNTLELVLISMTVLIVIKHISNIKRLLNGTENRFDKKKKSGVNNENCSIK